MAKGIVSYATVCSFDQNLRPLSANIDVCLSNIDVTWGEVSAEENLRLTSALTVEVGKILGLALLCSTITGALKWVSHLGQQKRR